MQIAGIALITIGAIPLFRLGELEAGWKKLFLILKSSRKSFLNFFSVFPENNPTIVPITVVVLGSIIFIISFFGCCGAIRENQCMVSTYAFFLLVIIVLQIILAVFAFMYTEDLANAAYDGFNKLFNQAQSSQEARIAVEGIQRGLSCCGSTGPASWGANIPDSCCADGSQCTIANSFPNGCASTIHEVVNTSGLLIAWFAVCFAGIQLVGVIFACCLANSIRNASRRQYA